MVLKTLQDGFRSGKYSDLILVAADGREFTVHKMVLDAKCPELLKESTEYDGCVGVLEDGNVIEKVLQWMYGITWSPPRIDIEVSDHLTEMHELLKVARKYDPDTNINEDTSLFRTTLMYGARIIENIQDIGQIFEAIQALAMTTISAPFIVYLADLGRQMVDGIGAIPSIEKSMSARSSMEQGHHEVFRGEGTGQPADQIPDEKALGAGYQPKIKAEKVSESPMPSVPQAPAQFKYTKGAGKVSKPSGTKKQAASKVSKRTAPSTKRKPKRNSNFEGPTYCVCDTQDTLHLVACEDCGEEYHPACIGKTPFAASTYNSHRKRCQKKDYERFQKEGEEFHCGCEDDE